MVQIITDSSTLYTPEEAKELGFDVMPLCVSIGDLEGRDLLVDMKDFYGRIQKGEIPMSSQPPIGEVMDMYEKYKDYEIVNIAMADGLSGTYQSACGAREMAENKDNITVFNCKTLCGPHRYMVEKAQKNQVTQQLELEQQVDAPVSRGQRLGTLYIKAGEQVLKEIPMVAEEAVEKLTFWQMFSRIFQKLVMAA